MRYMPCLVLSRYEKKQLTAASTNQKVFVYDNPPGFLVAHENDYLLLLPLGPDKVHRFPLHKPRRITTHQYFY